MGIYPDILLTTEKLTIKSFPSKKKGGEEKDFDLTRVE
jgi:hypothetical protein